MQHGQSTIGSAGVSTAQMASDYAAILEAYELTNTTLVGHSMGGFISIAFLLDGHAASVSRVGSLLLMGTFASDVNRDNPQNRVQIPPIKSGILQRLLRFGPVGQEFTKSLIGDDYKPEMADAFVPTFMQAKHSRLIPILQAMVDESRYDRLNEITIPTTVLVGEKDKTTPAFHTEDLHRGIAGSKLVRLPGIGHGLNWEAPDRVVEEIKHDEAPSKLQGVRNGGGTVWRVDRDVHNVNAHLPKEGLACRNKAIANAKALVSCLGDVHLR